MRRQRSARRADDGLGLGVLGLFTALALAVGLVLSFNIDGGLPGAKTYDLTVEVPNANRMIQNNQVRIDGVRIGRVADVEAIPPSRRDPAGAPRARLRLSLSTDAGPLRTDTTVRIRPASVLGATYVDLQPGRKGRELASGATLGLGQATEGVEITDLFDAFAAPTPRQIRGSLNGLGGMLIGKGAALGAVLSDLNRTAPLLHDVLREIDAPGTRFGRFLAGLDSASAAFADAGSALGGAIDHAGGTFDAVAEERQALEATLDELPSTMRVSTGALQGLQPALRRLSVAAVALEPAADRLPAGLDAVDATVRSGMPLLRSLPAFGSDLRKTAGKVAGLARDPDTDSMMRKAIEIAGPAGRLLESLADAQEHCNVISGFGRNWYGFAGHVGAGPGPSLANAQIVGLGTNPIEILQNAEPLQNLHTNYLPNENEQECESGNEPFSDFSRSLANPPGLQPKNVIPTDVPPEVRRLPGIRTMFPTPPGG